MRKFLSQSVTGMARILRKRLVIRPAGSAPVALSLENNDPGANSIVFEMFRDSASPAASDSVGTYAMYGRDSGGNKELYTLISNRIIDPADGTEDAAMGFEVKSAGILYRVVNFGGGIWTEGVTGGDPGAGKINAAELQVNGAALPFTKEFVSSNQTLTSAGALTIAHSLGVRPKLTQVWLECQTAEHGYSIGDQVQISTTDADASRSGVSLVADATNLNIRYGNSAGIFLLVHKTSGAAAVATNGNWRAIFKAWA